MNPVATADPIIIPLTDLSAVDRGRAGAKAANLGELLRAGFRVPPGFVVTGDPSPVEIVAAWQQVGSPAVAVRSSAVAEDLTEASFAGQYETVLDVSGGDDLILAVQRVRASGSNDRVQSYRGPRQDGPSDAVAVLVQRMLRPDAAGVAFTANPVTGDRGEVIITSARGLGERVVAGEAIGDEWSVRQQTATCRRSTEGVLNARQAREIARLARRIERIFGAPQDVEWAVEDGRLYILQTRPMTALPDVVQWTPPEPGEWVRNFRLGEWLPEPMTPLFREWLLERLEAGFLRGMQADVGAVVPFRHTAIQGWYYTAPPRPQSTPTLALRAAIHSRGRVFHFLLNALIRPLRHPERADRALLAQCAGRWRDEVLPRYQRAVAAGWAQVNTGTVGVEGLEALVDDLGRVAGEYFWSLAVVGGSAWKMEQCLARFLGRELPDPLGQCAPQLLRGLAEIDLNTPSHAVQSVDWYWSTAGESTQRPEDPDPSERHGELAQQREAVTAACRAALAARPASLARFDGLLEVTQRYAILREAQARWFTLAWPLLRGCALRLGEELQGLAVIGRAEDVFFLVPSELHSTTSLHAVVRERRRTWEHQRTLAAPLEIGSERGWMRKALAGSSRERDLSSLPEGTIIGEPASSGRATGPVCLIRGVDDFAHFQDGSVLVARATAPAWTPLFGRAAAVVTDAGTLAAHASLVAREYGIPAVVATGDATTRLRDGQVVIVDGSLGVVVPQSAGP